MVNLLNRSTLNPCLPYPSINQLHLCFASYNDSSKSNFTISYLLSSNYLEFLPTGAVSGQSDILEYGSDNDDKSSTIFSLDTYIGDGQSKTTDGGLKVLESEHKGVALIPGGFKPPTIGHFALVNEVARQIRMRSHSDCITTVLLEYFERTPDGWVHHRADKEIEKVGEKSTKASKANAERFKHRVYPDMVDGLSTLGATVVSIQQHIARGMADGEQAPLLWCKYNLEDLYENV